MLSRDVELNSDYSSADEEVSLSVNHPRRSARMFVVGASVLAVATGAFVLGYLGGRISVVGLPVAGIGAFSEGAKVDPDVHYDIVALATSELPLPECSCTGHNGATDGYRWGATANDTELCMGTWGGHHTPCYPLDSHGHCRWGSTKCQQSPLENTSVPKPAADDEPCLCVFDVDRTLTAKQYSFKSAGHGKQRCPNSSPVWGAWDNAYGSGTLTLSHASAAGIATTSCSKCHLGVCSAGTVGNWKEKVGLADNALNTAAFREFAKNNSEATRWTWGIHVPASSPLIAGVPDRRKQYAVEGIVQYYWARGVQIKRNRVWFFDDRADNTYYFSGTGFNARQISCSSRDWQHNRGMIGSCGAVPEEVTRIPGVYDCRHPPSANLKKQYAYRSNATHPVSDAKVGMAPWVHSGSMR